MMGEEMEDIQKAIINCSLCGDLPKLKDVNMQFGKTQFIIVGESPAKDGWIESKRAFYNVYGKLQASGRVLEASSKNCRSILAKQLKSIPCNIIVTMGLHPTQALLDMKIKKFADYVGKDFDLNINGKDFKLIPLYHPSPLNPKGYKDNIPVFKHIKELCI